MTVVAVVRRLHFRVFSVAAVWPRLAQLFIKPVTIRFRAFAMVSASLAGRVNVLVFFIGPRPRPQTRRIPRLLPGSLAPMGPPLNICIPRLLNVECTTTNITLSNANLSTKGL